MTTPTNNLTPLTHTQGPEYTTDNHTHTRRYIITHERPGHWRLDTYKLAPQQHTNHTSYYPIPNTLTTEHRSTRTRAYAQAQLLEARTNAAEQRKAWLTALDTLGEALEAQTNGHEPKNLSQLIDAETNAYIAYRTAERAYQTHLTH